jgi:hypothetical protein
MLGISQVTELLEKKSYIWPRCIDIYGKTDIHNILQTAIWKFPIRNLVEIQDNTAKTQQKLPWENPEVGHYHFLEHISQIITH